MAAIILTIQTHTRAAMNDGIQMIKKFFRGSASHRYFHQSDARYSNINAAIAVINGIMNRYFLFHSSSQYIREIIGIYRNGYINCRIGSGSILFTNRSLY